MEASVVEREHALQSSPALERAAERRGPERLIPLLFLGSVLAMYLVIGYAIYAVIAGLH